MTVAKTCLMCIMTAEMRIAKRLHWRYD